jgi:hypothetical protein
MNNKNKAGHVIKDDHIKRVKKLFKKNPIKLVCKIWSENVELEIVNIRKYEQNYSYIFNRKIKTYCYELDVKVKISENQRWWVSNNKRRLNDRLRSWSNEKLLLEELQFFGIEDICVSKVQYV